MSSPSGIVILLNGYPGVGKSSVAKELLKILPNAKMLEYHSLRAVIDPLIDREKDTDRWMEMKKALLQTLLTNLGSNPPSNPTINTPPIYIITSHLCATPSRLSVLHSHLSSSALPLIHILLNCSTEENLRRLKSDSRRPSPTTQIHGPTSGISHHNGILNVNFDRSGNGMSNEDKNGNFVYDDGSSLGKFNETHNNNNNDNSGEHITANNNNRIGKITDESILYELRMEEELGKFYTSNGLKSTGIPGFNGITIEQLKKKGLLGEFEVNTNYLDLNQTAMLISEYFLQVTRENGWFIRLLNPQRK